MLWSEGDLRFTRGRVEGQASNESGRGCSVLHIPTGIAASSTRERTYLENQAEALDLLADCLERQEAIERPTPTRPSWDTWGLTLAAAAATRGDCSRSQVGAVILDVHHRVASAGYNGAPPGKPGCLSDGACPRATSDVAPGSDYGPGGPGECIALHAEVNAVANGDAERMRGGTIYITRAACSWCTKVIAAAGIVRVVAGAPDWEARSVTEMG